MPGKTARRPGIVPFRISRIPLMIPDIPTAEWTIRVFDSRLSEFHPLIQFSDVLKSDGLRKTSLNSFHWYTALYLFFFLFIIIHIFNYNRI